jgi:hypothetical protein
MKKLAPMARAELTAARKRESLSERSSGGLADGTTS